MATGSMGRTVERLRKAVLLPDGGGLTDTQLLELFLARRDEAAFEALVRRHGPMVHGVCRRVAIHEHDAEDAFQATFLALARKAAGLRRRELVGNWLYGAAYRAALETRTATARRRAKEKPMAGTSEPFTVDETDDLRELQPLLDRELSRLPEKYRVPVVLCELEGRPRKDVARQLGIPEGTLSSRLATARKMLAKRLARHGLSVSGGALASALSAQATAAVPAPLLAAAVRAATAGTAGAVSAHVVALADGVLRVLFLAKLKVTSVVLAVGVVLAGTGLLAHHALAPEATEQPPAADAREQVRTDLYGDPLPEGAVARLGTMRMRHTGLSDFVILPDGKTVLTAGVDRVLRFWDMASGRQVRSVPLQQPARSTYLGPVSLSRDGRLLAAHEGPIVIYDVNSGKVLKVMRGPPLAMGSLRLSPDGKWLFVRDRSSFLVYDWQDEVGHDIQLPTGKGPRDSTFHTCFSQDGKYLVIGKSWQTPLCVFETASQRELLQLKVPYADCSAVAPDGKLLAVVGSRNDQGRQEAAVWLFELPTGKPRARFPLGYADNIYSIAFSPDGRTLALGGSERGCLLDCATGRVAHHLPPRLDRVTFSPDGKRLVSRGWHRLRTWEVATGKELLYYSADFYPSSKIVATPDSRLLAEPDLFGHAIRLWDARSGRLVRQIPIPEPATEGNFSSLRFSPDGRSLVTCRDMGLIQTWDVATGKESRRARIVDHKAAHPHFRFHHPHVASDGRHVSLLEVCGTVPLNEARLALWESTTNQLVKRHPIPANVHDCTWLEDGRSVALPTSDGLILTDVNTGAERFRIPGTTVNRPPAVSPDERLLAVPRQDKVTVWETATGKEVATVTTGQVGPIALTRDNRALVTGDTHYVRVWDLATGKERHRWSLPESAIIPQRKHTADHLLLFSDDCRAFTTLADGTALVWDLTPALNAASPAADAGEKDLAARWDDLASDDARRAYAAVWRLEALPEKVVLPFLRKHVRPAGETDFAKVRTLIKELDSDQFETREKASQQLQTLGDAAAPLLREALEKKPTLETRRRLETLLSQAPGVIRSPDVLRRLRALQVVERRGSDAARQFLRELAAGVPHAPETLAAKAALERLDRRATGP